MKITAGVTKKNREFEFIIPRLDFGFFFLVFSLILILCKNKREENEDFYSEVRTCEIINLSQDTLINR